MSAPYGSTPKGANSSRIGMIAAVFAAAFAAAGAGVFISHQRSSRTAGELEGYISSVATLEQEYARFEGKVLQSAEVQEQFEQAAAHTAKRDYIGAAALLESASKRAAVPVIFNDLGVLYAALKDRSRAVTSFREALARDFDYRPVRTNLQRLKGFTANSADPVTREIEPNNNLVLANRMAVNLPVEAQIESSTDDVDYFRVTAPPAPRDRLSIEIENRSGKLSVGFRLYNADQRIIDLEPETRYSDTSVSHNLVLAPNTPLYIQVFGRRDTGGPYILTLKAYKAFDSFEPNDDIFKARAINIGETINANIMDALDTDFYSFIAPRTGNVSITIQNKSDTLIPALTTFSSEMRNTGFGPDVKKPGAGLQHSIEVVQNQTYYLQVWSQRDTAGNYSLKVE